MAHPPTSPPVMSDADLRKLERLTARASGTRWQAKHGELLIAMPGGGRMTAQCYSFVPMPGMEAQFRNPDDLAFIVAARTAVPALIAEVRRLRTLLTAQEAR